MTVVLPYTNKISGSAPTGSFTEDVKRFKTGSYTVRATLSVNPSLEEWTVIWTGLSTTEASDIKNQIQSAAGITTFLWQSPLSQVLQEWTITKHSAIPIDLSNNSWSYSATLTLEAGG